MPVSGLVITLSDEPGPCAAALSALAREKRIELGLPEGRRLPIVVETRDSEEDRILWDWLHGLDGVLFVDVACIHFDDDAASQSRLSEEVPA